MLLHFIHTLAARRPITGVRDERGYVPAALDVVLGIGTYTMSTLANRLTGAPVDDQLSAFV